MEKSRIVKEIIRKLEADFELLKTSAKVAHEAATHEESKAEDKYDTRGLEASYLAGAQAKRAAEILSMITAYQNMELPVFHADSGVAATAVVEVEADGIRGAYFLAIKGGGFDLQVDDKKLQVISVTSPLGEALIGRRVGETFEVLLGKGRRREFEILALS